MRGPLYYSLLFLGLVALAFLFPFCEDLMIALNSSPTKLLINNQLDKNKQCASFILIDPEDAPPEIREEVLYGYHILLKTPELMPDFVGGHISCTNCHFSAGNTLGGKGGSISLAGIAAVYPTFNARSKSIITLEERISNCFQRSLNGKSPALNSREMNAITTYLHWISKDYRIYQQVPWRGLKHFPIEHSDSAHGKEIYYTRCAMCHGKEGDGAIRVPPLWGKNSFNNGAGLYQLDLLSAFIFANMPFQDECLTEQEAIDVAAFVREQPRPQFNTSP